MSIGLSWYAIFSQGNQSCLEARQICQIASGLAYLHGLNPPVVHGDIKGVGALTTLLFIF